ncbi:unnamed protein product [Mycena citricolor]|uniref:Reverse transcriptase domain-containing protein n=1 Tax=Mycena citricolor TaxID=2018698 RepID=A0AAD2HHL2_9AGAR|nr:unnamed protein product [Mycena citricolor]
MLRAYIHQQDAERAATHQAFLAAQAPIGGLDPSPFPCDHGYRGGGQPAVPQQQAFAQANAVQSLQQGLHLPPAYLSGAQQAPLSTQRQVPPHQQAPQHRPFPPSERLAPTQQPAGPQQAQAPWPQQAQAPWPQPPWQPIPAQGAHQPVPAPPPPAQVTAPPQCHSQPAYQFPPQNLPTFIDPATNETYTYRLAPISAHIADAPLFSHGPGLQFPSQPPAPLQPLTRLAEVNIQPCQPSFSQKVMQIMKGGWSKPLSLPDFHPKERHAEPSMQRASIGGFYFELVEQKRSSQPSIQTVDEVHQAIQSAADCALEFHPTNGPLLFRSIMKLQSFLHNSGELRFNSDVPRILAYWDEVETQFRAHGGNFCFGNIQLPILARLRQHDMQLEIERQALQESQRNARHEAIQASALPHPQSKTYAAPSADCATPPQTNTGGIAAPNTSHGCVDPTMVAASPRRLPISASVGASTQGSALALADSTTHARSAGPGPQDTRLLATLRNPVLRSKLFPVVTPLVADAWERHIAAMGRSDEFADVPKGIRNGFPHGLAPSPPLSNSHIPNNHQSALDHADVIDAYLLSEIALGRVSPGYNQSFIEQFIGFVNTSPLGVVQKDPSDPTSKFRMINDHSYPRNNPAIHSVNSRINKLDFPCTLSSWRACYRIIASAPSSTQASVFDVKSAFRNIPTLPADRPFTAISWRGLIFLDHVFSFGATSSPGVFDRLAELFVVLLKFYSAEEILKWVDDFVFFRKPVEIDLHNHPTYAIDESLFIDLAAELGFPWEMKKHSPFGDTFSYNGFDWCISSRTCTLPEKKRVKYLTRIRDWLAGGSTSRKESEVVVGTLNHLAVVAPEGRSRLVSLYRLSSAFNHLSNPFALPSPRAAHGNQPPDIEDDGIIPSMIMNAWAPSTRKKRIPITSLFQTFCEEEGVCALPASETTLCKFTLHRAGTIAGVTIRGAVAAIHAWHTQLGYVWNGGERLSACQKAAENLTPASSRFPKRPPFTMQHLETLAAKLSKDDPLDVAVFALATRIRRPHDIRRFRPRWPYYSFRLVLAVLTLHQDEGFQR